jgi:putative hydrolase of HD superfamily
MHTNLSGAAERLARQIAFIIEADKLKTILRRNRVITEPSRHENDAEHSFHFALMVIVLAEHANAPVDVLRVLKMVLIHDLVEIDVGDTFIYDAAGQVGQHEREAVAAERIFGLLPADQAAEFRALWDEFEARESADARFAAALDRLQPLLGNYCTQGGAWKEFGVTADQVFERNSRIAHGSDALWDYARGLLDESIALGYLREKPASPHLPEVSP